MIKLNVHCSSKNIELEYDLLSDLEVLYYQIFSLLGNDDCNLDILLLDSMGREIGSQQDLLDLSRALANEESLVDVWFFESDIKDHHNCCSTTVFKEEPVIQKSFRLIDTNFNLCHMCSTLFDPSLIVPEPDTLRAFVCDCPSVVDFGFLSESSVQHLKSVSEKRIAQIGLSHESSALLLYYRRKLLDSAIEDQRQRRLKLHGAEAFRSRVESTIKSVKLYEDPEQQRVAREVTDFAKINQYIIEYKQSPDNKADDEIFMHALLRWFKCDHFKWCTKPKCSNAACKEKQASMEGKGVVEPSAFERTVGWAGRTELYECNHCHQITRFPRYNNPSYLLKHSPMGRCGEFANAFCLLCRSLGLDARYVLDFTDHVWVEVWLDSFQRFAHCDPCERALDTPLMYEAGWNKSLSHVLSISRYGVEDASPRYSRKQREILVRRNQEIASECVARDVLRSKDQGLERDYCQFMQGAGDLPFNTNELCVKASIGITAFLNQHDISVGQMQERKRLQKRELLALTFETSKSWKLEELQGRISGDTEWKASRGELGTAPTTTDTKVNAIDAVVIEKSAPPSWWNSRMICDSMGQQHGYHSVASQLTASRVVQPFHSLLAPAIPCDEMPTASTSASCSDSRVSLITSSDRQIIGGAFFTQGRAYIPPTSNDSAAPPSALVSINVESLKGYICSTPCDVAISIAGENRADFIERLTQTVLATPHLLGFSLPLDESNAVVALTAVLFSDSGYPLRPSTAIETYYKQLSEDRTPLVTKIEPAPSCGPTFTDLSPAVDPTITAAAASTSKGSTSYVVPFRKDYYYLGGGQHGDTRYFDSSADLDSFLPDEQRKVEAFVSRLHLVRVVVWSGVNIVNGVQCIFTVGDAVIQTQAHTSGNDNPQRYELTLTPNEHITSVSVRYGALVDSLTLTTSLGQKLTVGGSGGEHTSTLVVPVDMRLVGFIGGCGGHLHNLGVVLMNVPLESVSDVTEVGSLIRNERLLKLSVDRRLLDCGYLFAHPNAGADNMQRIGTLLRLLDWIMINNGQADVNNCLKTIVTYLENMNKDLQNKKTQSIRLSNAFLNRNILNVRGGLQLLCWGPGCFCLSSDMNTVESSIADHLAKIPPHERGERSRVIREWIVVYVEFLKAVMKE